MLSFGQAILRTVSSLARTSPDCRRRRVAPSSRRCRSAACETAGDQIPSPKEHVVVRGHHLSDQRRRCCKAREGRWWLW